MPTIQEYRDALAKACATLEAAEHWLAEEAASPHPGQTRPDEILRAIREALGKPHDAPDAAPAAPQTPKPEVLAIHHQASPCTIAGFWHLTEPGKDRPAVAYVINREDAALFAAARAMLAALRLAKPVCADAYYDALAVQENPTGDAKGHPAENAQSTAAALAAWEAVNAAIAAAEGRA